MKTKTIKYGLIIMAFGVLAGISIVLYIFNKPKLNIATAKADYSLTATELIIAFTENEEAANAKYLSPTHGKIIRVAGIISEIGLHNDGTLNILLKEPAMGPGSINCSMGSTETPKAKALKPGDKISIKGECTGYLDITNEVLMIKCVFDK
ncbi:MAG TPA: hypothetical protein VK152_03195 [Paludibacter sp.]|nr:hypothetical protein [Paludibacter sp.]